MDSSNPPAFLDTPLLQDSYRFVCEAFARRARGPADLDHSVAVARLLKQAGSSEELVAAGLLHDVIEDTHTDPAELRSRFGDAIADRVATVTENPMIGDYATRKAALRGQVTEAGRDAATIFAADKLARVRAIDSGVDPPPPDKLAHYRNTLALISAQHLGLPFVDELGARLDELDHGLDPEQQTALLREGSRVLVRRISPSDGDALARMYERLSPLSRERRFLSAPDQLSPEDLRYLTDVDGRRHDALVALDEATGELVGEARYVRETDRRDTGEVAVVVADDWQGRGIATALLLELTRRARRQGLRRYTAIVSTDNEIVLDALAGLGGEPTPAGDGQVTLEFDVPAEGLSERLRSALSWSARGQLRLLGAIARRFVPTAQR
jgi:RimJ/RimL family protein N-acetyltransferase